MDYEHQCMLEIYQAEIDEGQAFSLITAIKYCAKNKLQHPDWLRSNIITAYGKLEDGQKMEVVFGTPHPKGTHTKKIIEKRNLKRNVHLTIYRLKKERPSKAIGDGLFEEVADLCGVSKTVASEAYYSISKTLRDRIRKIK